MVASRTRSRALFMFITLITLLTGVVTTHAEHWSVEEMWAGGGNADNSVAIDSSDLPHIAFRYRPILGDPELWYASYTGTSWNYENVDSGAGGIGTYNSIALDSTNSPHISYYGNPGLKYAYYNGASWSITTVDSTDFLAGYY